VNTNFFKSFVSVLIPAVYDPPIGLHEDSGAQISVWVPPVAGATSAATGT